MALSSRGDEGRTHWRELVEHHVPWPHAPAPLDLWGSPVLGAEPEAQRLDIGLAIDRVGGRTGIVVERRRRLAHPPALEDVTPQLEDGLAGDSGPQRGCCRTDEVRREPPRGGAKKAWRNKNARYVRHHNTEIGL